MAGRLVAICGIDGSGKATQAGLLACRARSAGWTVREVSFPRYGQGIFAELIERYLRGEFAAHAADVDPHLASLPFALDRWEACGQVREWLAEGSLVICNRYVPANMAHQGGKLPDDHARRAFIRWVDRLEYDVLALPRPDLHVLLDLEPEVSSPLVRQRAHAAGGRAASDIHETDLDHLRATAQTYRMIAQTTGGPWVTVPCTEAGGLRSREDIAADVWAAVAAIL